ncbi:MAG: FAD-dependent oxidoreductase [Planctomycetes bacterium]|nr:FAD-dependent oxidoreductase [Planctomycetota bacterium]
MDVRVAIIGAGPSAFYGAAALLASKDHSVKVDMFDRLAAPFGLVRYGVAPDHPRIKSVTTLYEKTAADARFRFFGAVDFGRDLKLADLESAYDMILFCSGAQSDRSLGIPGEDLQGSMSATEFVAWYNGHPDYENLNPNLDIEGVVVVGVGNVAMDVARILAKSPQELATTDIADHALAALSKSRVKDIYVLGRRGPAQAKFTNPEIKEFGHLAVADPVVRAAELELDPQSAAECETDRLMKQNVEILASYIDRGQGSKQRRVHFRFLVSPVEITGRGKVEQVKIEQNKLEAGNAVGTGEFETVQAGMVLRSVGYKGVPLADVPFDGKKAIIPNAGGRVTKTAGGEVVPGLYVAGWAKRGPTGVIGTNKKDAEETVALMLQDVGKRKSASGADVAKLLQQRGVKFVNWQDWKKIDAAEIEKGNAQNRPRVKLVGIDEMRAVL